MTDVYKAPYGTYATPTSINNAGRAQLLASLTVLLNFIPDTTGVATTYMTDFDEIPPHTAAKIRAELTAIYNTVAGAPTSVTKE